MTYLVQKNVGRKPERFSTYNYFDHDPRLALDRVDQNLRVAFLVWEARNDCR